MGILIAITGKSGSGKSTVLSNLACALAQTGRTVGCLSCDLRYPSLQHFFKLQIPKIKSLGSLFESENPVLSFSRMSGKDIFVSGINDQEGSLLYEPPDINTMTDFYHRLLLDLDYVIIEAGEIRFNSFSAVGVQAASVLLEIAQPTVQGALWGNATEEETRLLAPEIPRAKILNNDPKTLERADFLQAWSIKPLVELPFVKEVALSESTGLPVYIDSAVGLRCKKYIEGINRVRDFILEGGEEA